MSDNIIDTILVGAGNMAKEHCKVLKDLHCNFAVIGRGEGSAKNFESEMGITVIRCSISEVVDNIGRIPLYAIVAVGVEQLKNVTLQLVEIGVKNILVEKPAGLNVSEIGEINEYAQKYGANIFVAYNRRFYASVDKANEIIADDGGVDSFNFEFTEWAHTIEPLEKPVEVKEAWLLANSTHVIDLAFFLGGFPEKLVSYSRGSLSWHTRGSSFCGAGISKTGALFNYGANWEAPGRWSVEVLTKKHRLYFKPLEKLLIQELKTVKVDEYELDDSVDKKYKPGVYNMLHAFFNNTSDKRLVSINEHYENSKIYEKIEVGTM